MTKHTMEKEQQLCSFPLHMELFEDAVLTAFDRKFHSF